ncbi:site-specific tyrosine recombinase XerD [Posidoniimonas polymericola]|uniref:Site-specific tyrosine recombinase XerD n=1 Tax=Posidoniimonas polymericola TaxID=2528002 RepID=A0A5C5XWN5_9BACT|nr:tyrosine-type recombinase/integrase [Posidoniimonas polymericola]TWT66919.1 site-specific tyrosine recombinase XerD [Posidoniimonas polymericola]
MATATATPKQRTKPTKPYADFPLFPHARGYWAKKIKGKVYYFDRWENPDSALQQYLDQRDDLYAGRKPRERNPDGVTLRELCNALLTAKEQLVESGELTRRHFQDLHKTCERLINHFGKNRLVEDLRVDELAEYRTKLSSGWAPTTLGPELNRVRSVFNFGYKSGILDKEVRAASALASPSKKILRAHRQSQPKKLFSAEQVQKLLNSAGDHQFKAMLHLAINAGFGNRDCATITPEAFDLESGWVQFPRTKTAIDRRCPLWPETVEAMRQAFEARAAGPKPASGCEDRAFLTSVGNAWGGDMACSAVSQKFRRVAKAAGCYTKGVSFYSLRHTFATIGGDTGDQVAVRYLMGHVDPSIDAVYREAVMDERLERVTSHVRQWLFGS